MLFTCKVSCTYDLVWFDSLGAKASCFFISISSIGILIDPGAAAMQPSYPLPREEKLRLKVEAAGRIESFSRKADVIIVTHYHYDHHFLPSNPILKDPKSLYLGGKLLVLKNPNMYINESQWNRARKFIGEILELSGLKLESFLMEPRQRAFSDPVEDLTYALERDFGDYSGRRKELLEKGRRWFDKLTRLWSSQPWIKAPIKLPDGTRIIWGDNCKLKLGNLRITVFPPWFHGIEYDRTGWVTPVLLEGKDFRIFYTSDLMGPQIEDYAYAIADLKPDILIADGPPTYLFPFMLNRINLERAVENMCYIIEEAKPELIIYDHHLLREKRWRQRVRKVLDKAKTVKVMLLTAAEYLGRRPLIDEISKLEA